MTPELITGRNTVEQSTDDADTMIVSAALESALTLFRPGGAYGPPYILLLITFY